MSAFKREARLTRMFVSLELQVFLPSSIENNLIYLFVVVKFAAPLGPIICWVSVVTDHLLKQTHSYRISLPGGLVFIPFHISVPAFSPYSDNQQESTATTSYIVG